MKDRRYFFKYASMIYRISNRYYDQKLAPYGIGSGQQFFCCALQKMTESVCLT